MHAGKPSKILYRGVSGSEGMMAFAAPSRGGRQARTTAENALYVDFYEAAGRVKRSLFPSVRFHFRRWLLRRHRPVSRGFIILLFALIRGKRLSSPAHEGNSRGGGAIYAAALGLRPSQHARSPSHRTYERPRHSPSCPVVHAATVAAARGCGERRGSNTLPSRSSA